MRRYTLLIFGIILISLSCKNEAKIVKEDWVDKPLSNWPDFALINKISFTDTTYTDIANAFLVNTGFDTLGISCKHLFMVFEKHQGLKNVDLGDEFNYWELYPKNKKEKRVSINRLINTNSNEPIDQFNTLKVRDWIVFEIKNNPDLYPLKIRYTPVKTNEVVYAIGWGNKQKDNSKPAVVKMQCVKNVGDYYYIKTLSTNVKPYGRSGSPVIDKNGHLVGIVSGQEGKLGVIGSVNSLVAVFDKFDIQYNSSGF